MRIRRPPGRAGRLWVIDRLAVAHRGHDVLEQKRHALVRQLATVEEQRDRARGEWDRQASEAELWWQRAAVLAGERPLELAQAAVTGPAEVAFEWRNALGVVYPAHVSVALPEDGRFPAGGSAALAYAAGAHRRALVSGAELAAAELARARTERELGVTTQRLRALERRWIPAHERELHDLELALDVADREEAVRVRWALGRRRRDP